MADRELYFPIAQLMFVQAIISVLLVFAPNLSLALLKAPLQDTSLFIVVPAAAGMIAGIVLVTRLARHVKKMRLIKGGILFAGLAMLGLGLSGQLYRTNGFLPLTVLQVSLVVAGLVLIVGFSNAVVSVVGQTVLQENTADEMRGKVFGALNMMLNIALTLPVLIAAIAADLWSVTKVISLVGLLVALLAIFQIWWTRKPHHHNQNKATG